MSALPYQPVPTASQQRDLERWVQRKYPARQYRDNQDEAIADFQAARLRYEERQPEPCQFCYAPDDREIGLPLILGWCAMGLGVMGVWAAVFYATYWLVGFFLGVKA